jgi:hypothetical protein
MLQCELVAGLVGIVRCLIRRQNGRNACWVRGYSRDSSRFKAQRLLRFLECLKICEMFLEGFMLTNRKLAFAFCAVIFSSTLPFLTSIAASAAAGDNCSINLPSGPKEPGKDDGKGNCCSVLDSKKCRDIQKGDPVRGTSPPGSRGTTSSGRSCSINLPNGLKEPGKDDGKGHCCSVFDSKKCQDLKR